MRKDLLSPQCTSPKTHQKCFYLLQWSQNRSVVYLCRNPALRYYLQLVKILPLSSCKSSKIFESKCFMVLIRRRSSVHGLSIQSADLHLVALDSCSFNAFWVLSLLTSREVLKFFTNLCKRQWILNMALIIFWRQDWNGDWQVLQLALQLF